MPIEIKMPALSPTMEEGTLAKWLVKEGDTVKSGDILAEIETDKATMEFETIDEGTIAKLLVPEGADGVKVGATIAILAGEGEETDAAAAPARSAASKPSAAPAATPEAAAVQAMAADVAEEKAARQQPETAPPAAGDRVKASPLARRLAAQQDIDLGSVMGSGPNGRIVKADLASKPAAKSADAAPTPRQAAAPVPAPMSIAGIPSETVKLSNMRKTIARRLTEAKQTIPHIYLTVDIRLDALLALRGELNAGLATRGVKLSVNDLLIKAQAMALMEASACNVSFAGDSLIQYRRADISVAVSIPGGLITPIVTGADTKSISTIAAEMQGLAARARDGKLQPEEYQGGTASLSNMGMYGIKSFQAVINPPQAMILAIGAGEQRPYVIDGQLGVATVMSATGSFDHRAIDGADGAKFMSAFKRLVEDPLGMLA